MYTRSPACAGLFRCTHGIGVARTRLAPVRTAPRCPCEPVANLLDGLPRQLVPVVAEQSAKRVVRHSNALGGECNRRSLLVVQQSRKLGLEGPCPQSRIHDREGKTCEPRRGALSQSSLVDGVSGMRAASVQNLAKGYEIGTSCGQGRLAANDYKSLVFIRLAAARRQNSRWRPRFACISMAARVRRCLKTSFSVRFSLSISS